MELTTAAEEENTRFDFDLSVEKEEQAQLEPFAEFAHQVMVQAKVY